MENQPIIKRTHPLVPVAAGSVLVMSLVGIGVFTGLIPSAFSSRGEQPQAVAATTATTPATTTTAPVLPAAPQPTARPAHAAAAHKAAERAAERPVTVAAAECMSCGRVESIQTVETPGKASGVGAVAGGVGGAVVGHQFGNGNGRTALTILGAAGGALAGNAIEKNVRKEVSYRVNVRMDDGSNRSFPASGPAAYGVGERVRIDNGALVRVG